MKKKLTNEQLTRMLDRAYNEFEKALNNKERSLIMAYKTAFEEIQAELAKFYVNLGEISIVEANKLNRLSRLEKDIAKIIKGITGETIKTISESIMGAYEFGYYLTSHAIEDSLSMMLGFGMLNKATIESSVTNPYTKIKWRVSLVADTNAAIKDVRREISSGLIQGKGYPEVSKALQEHLYGTPKRVKGLAYKIDRIVRTESHRAHSEGRLASIGEAESAADRLGIGITRVWKTTFDSKTRQTHAEADGQVADADGMFAIGSDVMEAPGLGSLPEEVINCRCTVITQVDSLPVGDRRDNEFGGYTKAKDFEEWLGSNDIKMKYWKN